MLAWLQGLGQGLIRHEHGVLGTTSAAFSNCKSSTAHCILINIEPREGPGCGGGWWSQGAEQVSETRVGCAEHSLHSILTTLRRTKFRPEGTEALT